MTSVSYEPMSAQLLAALPELRPIADRVCGVEGLEVAEDNPYHFFGSVLAPHIDALLDADESPDRHEALQRVIAFLEVFVADPQWSSGGYNYALNVVDLEILEHLMSEGAEERLRLARRYLGPMVARSLAEMETWWEQERQRQRDAEAVVREGRPGKKKRPTTKSGRMPVKRSPH